MTNRVGRIVISQLLWLLCFFIHFMLRKAWLKIP